MGAGTSASKKYAVHADVEEGKKQSEKKLATEGRSAGAAEEDVWATVVADLARRGISVDAALDLYVLARKQMRDFDPKRTTTRDVVRRVVIPNSVKPEPRAYAQTAMKLVPTMPQRMVTHNWENLFVDLLAAVVADALGVIYYGSVAERLCDPDGVEVLREEIVAAERKRGSHGPSTQILARLTYWIDAVSVNQHVTIEDPERMEVNKLVDI